MALKDRPLYNGMRVPFIIRIDPDGRPAFKSIMNEAVEHCLVWERCGVCGGRLGDELGTVVITAGRNDERDALPDHIFFVQDPAMHRTCARYAIGTCPHLVRVGGLLADLAVSLDRWDDAVVADVTGATITRPDGSPVSAEDWQRVLAARRQVHSEHARFEASCQPHDCQPTVEEPCQCSEFTFGDLRYATRLYEGVLRTVALGHGPGRSFPLVSTI